MNECGLHIQHILHRLHVGRVNDCRVSQITFTLLAFFSQNVTLVSVLTFNLARSGERKPFLCSRFGLYFWHDYYLWVC